MPAGPREVTRPRKLRWYLHNALAEWVGDWCEYLQGRKKASDA